MSNIQITYNKKLPYLKLHMYFIKHVLIYIKIDMNPRTKTYWAC